MHVKGTLLVVLNCEGQALHLVLNLLQLRLVLEDLLHLVDFDASSIIDALVLCIYDTHINEDSVLVVRGNGKLRDLDLALLQVDYYLEVELELLLAINCLLESHLRAIKLLNDILLLTLEENDKVAKVAKPFLILCFELLHSDADLPLMDDVFKLLL